MDDFDWHGAVDEAVLSHIRRQARRLDTAGAVPGMDRADLEQEPLPDLWRRRGAFDPARSPFGAFARIPVAHRAAALAAPTARHRAERATVSLHAPLEGGEGDVTLADLLPDGAGGEDILAVQLDVRGFVAGLTPAMRRCCAALAATGTPALWPTPRPKPGCIVLPSTRPSAASAGAPSPRASVHTSAPPTIPPPRRYQDAARRRRQVITMSDIGRQRDERYLDQKQLAARWGLPPRSLERWRWRRLGPRWVKLGNKVRCRERDVVAYEEENLRGGGDGGGMAPPRRR